MTSFVPAKRAQQAAFPLSSKTKTSPFHANVPLAPSGIPELDTLLLPGGLPVPSLTTLISDETSYLADHFARVFVAQGLVEGEHVLIVHARPRFTAWLDELPGLPVESTPSVASSPVTLKDTTSSVPSDKLKIAWRYGFQPQPGSNAHHATLSRTLDLATRLYDSIPDHKQRIHNIDISESPSEDHMHRSIQQGISQLPSPARILVLDAFSALAPSLSSPSLRLLRLSLAASAHPTLLVIPTRYGDDSSALAHQLSVSTACMQLVFDPASSPPTATLAQGLLRLLSPIRWRALSSYVPGSTSTWFVTVTKRRFLVEPVSLPPEGQDAPPSRDTAARPTLGCSSTGSSGARIDF